MTLINGNRTEWSPIRFVIIRVITKSDDRVAGVRFVYHEYDYRLNRIYKKIFDRDWFSVRLFVIVIGPSGVQFRE